MAMGGAGGSAAPAGWLRAARAAQRALSRLRLLPACASPPRLSGGGGVVGGREGRREIGRCDWESRGSARLERLRKPHQPHLFLESIVFIPVLVIVLVVPSALLAFLRLVLVLAPRLPSFLRAPTVCAVPAQRRRVPFITAPVRVTDCPCSGLFAALLLGSAARLRLREARGRGGHRKEDLDAARFRARRDASVTVRHGARGRCRTGDRRPLGTNARWAEGQVGRSC